MKATYDMIEKQPANASVAIGKAAEFRVEVSGKPSRYQWQFKPNGGHYANLSGKNSELCRLNHVTASDTGTYRVVVTWQNGLLESDGAVLKVTH